MQNVNGGEYTHTMGFGTHIAMCPPHQCFLDPVEAGVQKLHRMDVEESVGVNVMGKIGESRPHH